MTSLVHSRRAAWISLGVLLFLMLVVVLLSPAEETLGAVVKVVYVHVAFSRAGAIGFYVAGLIGAVVLVTGNELLSGWMRSIGWVSLGLFSLGFVVSIAAQAAAWGGIAWREPRVAGALNVLAVAAMVQVLNSWLAWVQGRGFLRLLLAGFQLWTNMRSDNILHPGGAISSSTSLVIRLTGFSLAALAVLLGAWVVWQLRLRAAAFMHAAQDEAITEPAG